MSGQYRGSVGTRHNSKNRRHALSWQVEWSFRPEQQCGTNATIATSRPIVIIEQRRCIAATDNAIIILCVKVTYRSTMRGEHGTATQNEQYHQGGGSRAWWAGIGVCPTVVKARHEQQITAAMVGQSTRQQTHAQQYSLVEGWTNSP